MNILVTGGAGFVGGALLKALRAQGGYSLRTSVRQGGKGVSLAGVDVFAADLALDTDWVEALEGVDAVVHTAARVHVMNDHAADPLAAFRRTNVEGTLALARQAAVAGVRRFVYVSSVKVNGESTLPGRPFTERDVPAPRDPYGISKLEAEQGLWLIAQGSGMELVIIRPPLVYGPGVRANFRVLMRAVINNLPLPLAAVDNRRSLVALANLNDFIVTCINHPAAANEVFLVSDADDLSTPELVRRLSRILGKPPKLFSVPVVVLALAAKIVGRSAALERVCGNFQVDINKARTLLGWRPLVTVDQGLVETVLHIDLL